MPHWRGAKSPVASGTEKLLLSWCFWRRASLMVQLPLQQTKIGDSPVTCDEEELRRGPVAEDCLANEEDPIASSWIK